MTLIDKNIVAAYASLLEGLSLKSKQHLIERLNKSLKSEEAAKEEAFYQAFGGFGSNESAEKISAEIKESRRFRQEEIDF